MKFLRNFNKKQLQYNRNLVIELIRTEFKQKYNNSLLGFLWVFLLPFFNFFILLLVFKYFRGGDKDPFLATKMLFALTTYNYFKDGVSAGINSLISHSHIITKINFPKILALNSAILFNSVTYIINYSIIILVFYITNSISFTLSSFLYFVYILIVLTVFTYVLAFTFSVLAALIRDLQNIINVGFQALFWLSGIFYDLDTIRYSFKNYILINPLTFLIDAVKKAVISGEVSNLQITLYFSLIILALLPISFWFYKRNVNKVIEVL